MNRRNLTLKIYVVARSYAGVQEWRKLGILPSNP